MGMGGPKTELGGPKRRPTEAAGRLSGDDRAGRASKRAGRTLLDSVKRSVKHGYECGRPGSQCTIKHFKTIYINKIAEVQ